MPSPMQNTDWSRSISSRSAARSASRYLIFAIVPSDCRPGLRVASRAPDRRAAALARASPPRPGTPRPTAPGSPARTSTASSMRASTRASMASMRAGVHARPGEPLAQHEQRVVGLPALQLVLREVEPRVVHVVAAVAVGHALDQRRALAGARAPERLLHRLVDDAGVVAVHRDAGHPVGGGPIREAGHPRAVARSASRPRTGCSPGRRSPAGPRSRPGSAPRARSRWPTSRRCRTPRRPRFRPAAGSPCAAPTAIPRPPPTIPFAPRFRTERLATCIEPPRPRQ